MQATQQLQLFVGFSPNLNATEHWQYLTAYPYGCLEQTTSKSRPFSAILNNAGKMSNIGDATEHEVNKKTARCTGAL